MTMLEAMTTRRNIKAFKPDPISEQVLLAWLEAASYAPNHRCNEPWEIRRIGPVTRAKLKHKTDFGGAPVVIALLSKPGATPVERDENVMAAACFAQNFLLAAHEAGVGTFWSSLGGLPHNREILGVPENYDVIGVFGIGYPAEVPPVKPRTPISAKITDLP
ncbi:nitroreductase family protein [Paenibacillus macerans]|uniref:nitroreductase family protein n=1 Tax=Paenibacillus macerans TaxID=44252 RepID=UPI003D31D627